MKIKRTSWLTAISGSLLLLLAACGGGGATTGTINVSITGLPAGAAAPTVTATKGTETKTRTGAGTITGVAVGTWSVSGADVTHTDGFKYGANAVSANVTAGGTANAALAYAKKTAKLTVTITGLPAGTNANVTVTKPGGATQALTATQTLTLLDPGSYSVAAQSVTVGSDTYTATVTGSPATLAAGDEKTVTVAYAAPGKASLTVTINNTSGSNANVTVSGPGGFSQALTATQTLTNLTPGSYTVTAANITGSGANSGITYAGSVTGSPATLVAGGTGSVTVNYAATNFKITVSVSGADAAAKVFVTATPTSGTPLSGSRTGNGDVVLTGSSFSAYSIKVEAGKAGTNVDTYYINSAAAPSVTPTPSDPAKTTSVALVARGGTGNVGSGRMFLVGNGERANFGGEANGIYSSADSSLATLADVFATSSTQYFRVTFDKDGNFYYAIKDDTAPSNTKVVRVTEANLRAGKLLDTDAGNTSIGSVAIGGGLAVGLSDIATDASGNLWTVADAGNSIKCFSAATISAGGSINGSGSADQTITTTAPKAITFDKDGNLWFSAKILDTGPANTKPELSKVLAANANCTSGASGAVAFTLDISNSAGPGDPIVWAAGLLYDSARDSIWIADAGALAVDAGQEGVIEVPLADNTAPGAAKFRVRIRLDGTTNSLQQPYAMALDSVGKLWIATNNNVSQTGNSGKAYGLDKSGFATTSGVSPTDVTVAAGSVTVITGAANVGFTGIAFNTAPASISQQLHP